MTFLSLSFFGGILFLQFFSVLPSLSWVLVAILACFFLFYFKVQRREWIIAALLGFAWCLWCAHSVADFSLPTSLEGKTIWVKGRIASLPRVSSRQTSFLFQVDHFQDERLHKKDATLINLSWPKFLKDRESIIPRVGDEWLLPVRLKRIHGAMNPGGFDYEAWAFQNGIRAKGYIVEKEKPVFIAAQPFARPLDRLRQWIEEKARQVLPVSQTAPWLLALMIGERTGIAQSEWEVLRNTGTNHLMAIAGLHIGFMSALAQGLMCGLLRRRPEWTLYFPAPQAAACAALIMAVLYSSLAGFSIPTQRALIMLAVLLVTILAKRVIPLWQAWSLALFIVLLSNPLCVLSSSFWLSFTTLALILYGVSGRLAEQTWWWKWGRPQWVIALGLLPLSLWIFTQYSLVSFFANAVAIPWVGFLVLPLCFLSVIFLLLCPPLAKLTLLLADKSLALLWLVLTGLSQLPWATWHQVLPHYGYLVLAICGVLILLMPVGVPGRYLGFLWLLPVLFFAPQTPDWGELYFSLLDVGQGLSAVVETQHHILIFDAGARLGPEFDMGESVVLPFLHSRGIRKVDMLVVSHGDNDHSGGVPTILKQMSVLSIKTSVPLLFPSWSADYCLSGQAWVWDGVRFKFLHPDTTQLNLGNDSSCVLQVEARGKRILLAGDIEKSAEKFMLSNPENDLAADILVAPHHGSKTSGLREFIGRVHPQYVLYAVGYRNRFHFPHPGVVQTYQDWGAVQYDTVLSGTIQFRIRKNGLLPPDLYRRSQGRYWNAA